MDTRSPLSEVLGFAGWILVAFAAAAVGALASANAPSFYAALSKPSWAPPASLFGPVWSVLYLLMGIAVWSVWRSAGPKRMAMGLFAAQLAANALWSWLFFAWHEGALATVEIVILLILIMATIVAFSRRSRCGALLLVPYFLWVTFATALTFAIWRRNPSLL